MRIDMWSFSLLFDWLKTESYEEISKWLREHKVRILGSNPFFFVNCLEFELAYDKDTIEVIKGNYGKKWGKHYVPLIKSIYINKDNVNEVKMVGALIESLYEKGFSERDPIMEINEGRAEILKNKPQRFEELFRKPELAEKCLNVLRELSKPVIDKHYTYIGNNKGVIPEWVSALKKNGDNPLMLHFQDIDYKNVLNKKIINLNLSKDASEFRRVYTRIKYQGIDNELRLLVSKIS